jgi:hypothetical protein
MTIARIEECVSEKNEINDDDKPREAERLFLQFPKCNFNLRTMLQDALDEELPMTHFHDRPISPSAIHDAGMPLPQRDPNKQCTAYETNVVSTRTRKSKMQVCLSPRVDADRLPPCLSPSEMLYHDIM